MLLRSDFPPAGRLWCALLLAIAVCLGVCRTASAATSMVSIFQDDNRLKANPQATLEQMRLAGATVVKVGLYWYGIAPARNRRTKPRGFNGANPTAYPPGSWSSYDTIVRDAAADGMSVDFQLGNGAPMWAEGPGAPKKGKAYPEWEPSGAAFYAFVRAAGIRYSGRFTPKGQRTPLPRVSFWSVWNEPNLGFELAPQAVPHLHEVQNSGRLYRALLNGAWTALHQTGHGNDTILIGEIAPRGSTVFGVFNAMKPLIFMEGLYCVDSSLHLLRGLAAAERGCPTTASGSRAFKAQNPALFNATGVGVHLWARWYRPTVDPQHDPNYAGLPDLPHFQRALDTILGAYGSHKRFNFYNTEFGYITNPPNATAPFVSPATAAYYLNWAEYISWRNPRLRSFAQYLVQDPPPATTDGPYNLWAPGLFTYTGQPKATYSAWRLPLYLPVTSTTAVHSLEVWGCVRPAGYAIADTGQAQKAELQFAPSGSSTYTDLAPVTITNKSNCYFDQRLKFPSSGTVRLSWQYPLSDTLLGDYLTPDGPDGASATSRSIKVTVK
jgi:hypothetical protein